MQELKKKVLALNDAIETLNEIEQRVELLIELYC